MRVVMLVAFVCAMVCSCTGTERSRSADGTLVLELGGNHGSLRRALRLAGVAIGPRPVEPTAIEPTAIQPMAQLLGGLQPEPTPGPRASTPIEEPPPAPVDDPGFREVELQPDETISHLAQRHLGTMRRYGEILELNGWTERESRRLKVGIVVRIPLE